MDALSSEKQVVLVVSSASPLVNLDSLELRKIYLGFNVRRNGNVIRGFRNTEDKVLNGVFLQYVVAMSAKSYNKRLLSLTLRQGIPRSSEYNSIEKLQDALSERPYSVSYMWKEDAERSTKVKALRVLWYQN
ncbi:MAG: hypothetical protein DIZ80_02055 [endosymbiont of Galathealinum brachiosum]|uniref:Uncharacterized protein n=1 Tax=endosymbiont of Galathealinum brachiosum TaxID=2200906 RepID=A0A370DMX7_9GAMM|nr:MAG: hypothetical protein DIZ80_02055 [endosymbiont of Galathealinum brachiosum]